VGGDEKVGNDSYRLDLLGPGEADAMANAERRLGRSLSSVNTSGRLWEDLAEGDLDTRDILGTERLQIGADEATE